MIIYIFSFNLTTLFRKVEGSNTLADDGLELNNSASNADIDNIPMPLSNPGGLHLIL